MVNRAVLCGVLVVLAVSVACSGPPTRPSSNQAPAPPVNTTPPPITPPPPPTPFVPNFPAVSRPARVYVAERFPYYAYPHGSELASRFVLYDDGTFGLQYSSRAYAFFEYKGEYNEQNGNVTLLFHPNNGRWTAAAVISDAVFSVKFNFDMQMSDFEDGLYIRAR